MLLKFFFIRYFLIKFLTRLEDHNKNNNALMHKSAVGAVTQTMTRLILRNFNLQSLTILTGKNYVLLNSVQE